MFGKQCLANPNGGAQLSTLSQRAGFQPRWYYIIWVHDIERHAANLMNVLLGLALIDTRP
ncbi:conserved hypothetical protein [Ricinus communis]|uniref:Uncharacterized protein n=1 Tax=Ricinus communis TaxID=3988 RepID=B9ST32_RICCO|nr:conserved hypothetical protein [Ricinus communis]